MQKSFMQWLIQIIRRDMRQYEEDVGTKKKVYKATQYEKNIRKD